MKVVWFIFTAGVMCTMFAGNKNTSPRTSVSTTRSGIISSSLSGHLICTVTYEPQTDTYSGILINQHYEPSRWVLKHIDGRQALVYYNQLDKEQKEM